MQTGHFNKDVFPGAKFGSLTIVERLPREPNSNGSGFKYRVRCKCDCGKETTPLIGSLSSGLTKSCGCNQFDGFHKYRSKHLSNGKRVKVIPGAVFGRLTVIERLRDEKGWDNRKARCQCSCGNITVSSVDGLLNGDTKSCGCRQSERLATRNRKLAKLGGYSIKHLRTYASWRSMLNRCYLESYDAYRRYGARGIKVCEFFRKDPRNLVLMIGQRTTKKKTLDRYPDNKGNYSCGQCEECRCNGWKLNVRWATGQEQALNRTTIGRSLTAFGKTMRICEWVTSSGLSWSTIDSRLQRGWSEEDTVGIPNKKGKCYKPVT